MAEERDRARQVVESLRRRYAGRFLLKPVLWEDLPLQADMSFQRGIDLILSQEEGIDIAVFILWSRLGSPLGPPPKADGTPYRSGTERELELMLSARQQSGGKRPAIVVYARQDEPSFEERLRGRSTSEKQDLLSQKTLVEQFIAEEFHEGGTRHNVRAYHTFDRPVTFSQRLRAHLCQLLDELAGGIAEAAWDVQTQGPPFQGLEAFQPQHADVFFGREVETIEVRHALREQARNGCAFVLLSGASGSGKSSLARAGVLPAIVENELDEHVVAWRTLLTSPVELGTDPIAGLVRRLASPEVLPELQGGTPAQLDEMVNGLRQSPELTLRLWVKEAFTRAATRVKGGLRVLVVLDQLEELFATVPLSSQTLQEFLHVMEVLARSGHVWVVATVRSDFSAQVLAQPALVRMTEGRGVIPILPPQLDALRRVIEEPALLTGLTFEQREGRSLADRILKDTATHAELLPLLEYVLRELFERRSEQGVLTWQAYEILGGVEGALAQRAEAVYGALPPEAQGCLGPVLKSLVTLGQGSGADGAEHIVRRRMPLAKYSDDAGMETLVKTFVDARLFTAGHDPESGLAMVAVAHERLLVVWPRAVAWVAQNREFLRTRARVAARLADGSPMLEGDPLLQAAGECLASDPQSFSQNQRSYIEENLRKARSARRRRESMRRRVLAGLSLLTLVAVSAATVAGLQWRDAAREKVRAENEARRAEDEAKRAENEVTKQRQLILAAGRREYNAYLRLGASDARAERLAHLAFALELNPESSPALVASFAETFGRLAHESLTHALVQSRHVPVDLAFSRTGGWLSVVSTGQFGGAQVVESASGHPLCFYHDVHAAVFSPDDSLVTTGVLGAAFIYTLGSDKDPDVLGSDREPITSVSLTPDGRFLCAGRKGKAALLLDATSRKQLGMVPLAPNEQVMACSPDGRWVVVCGQETSSEGDTAKYRTLDFRSGAALWSTALHTSPGETQRRAEFSPDGLSLVLMDDAILRWIHPESGAIFSKVLLDSPARSISFSPDGRWLAVACKDGTVTFFNSGSGSAVRRMRCDDDATAVKFSPDGKWLAVGTASKSVRIETAALPASIKRLDIGHGIAQTAPGPDGASLQDWICPGTGPPVVSSLPAAHVAGPVWTSFLKYQAAFAFEHDGALRPLKASDWSALRQHLASARSGVSSSATRAALLAAAEDVCLHWWTTQPDRRTMTPWSNTPLWKKVGDTLTSPGLAADDMGETITMCADAAPWHPLAPVALARLEPEPPEGLDAEARILMKVRPTFLAQLTLRRLQDADVSLYGTKTLGIYATRAAEWMDALHLESEAKEARAMQWGKP